MSDFKILGIIPARYASTRFPAKPLADISGKSMIQRVYERASTSKSLAKVVVATDHEKIYAHVKQFGGEACMTREDHQSGTDRCYEALSQETEQFDYVINIQGDEPFIAPEQIDLLASCFSTEVSLATLVKQIDSSAALLNPNVVKAVLDKDGYALYFSREALPHQRGISKEDWLKHGIFYKHIGIYGYQSKALAEIVKLPVSALEKAEALEQLRWLENGYKIKTRETAIESMGIDTPEDLEEAVRRMHGLERC